MVVILH
jgi:hypothetical protein